MGIRFACSACHKPLNIKHDLAGKRSKCPKCGHRLRIPFQDQDFSDPVGDESSADGLATGMVANAPRATSEKNSHKTQNSSSQPAPSRTQPVAVATQTVDPLTENPQASWYVRPPSGGQYGPASADIMRQWIGENRIGASALVWCEGWATWREASQVFPQIASLGPSTTTAPPQPHPKAVPAVSPQEVDLNPAGEAFKAVAERRHLLQQRRNLIVIGLAAVSVLLIVTLIAVVMSK